MGRTKKKTQKKTKKKPRKKTENKRSRRRRTHKKRGRTKKQLTNDKGGGILQNIGWYLAPGLYGWSIGAPEIFEKVQKLEDEEKKKKNI